LGTIGTLQDRVDGFGLVFALLTSALKTVLPQEQYRLLKGRVRNCLNGEPTVGSR
jgi:hypothetical protein